MTSTFKCVKLTYYILSGWHFIAAAVLLWWALDWSAFITMGRSSGSNETVYYLVQVGHAGHAHGLRAEMANLTLYDLTLPAEARIWLGTIGAVLFVTAALAFIGVETQRKFYLVVYIIVKTINILLPIVGAFYIIAIRKYFVQAIAVLGPIVPWVIGGIVLVFEAFAWLLAMYLTCEIRAPAKAQRNTQVTVFKDANGRPVSPAYSEPPAIQPLIISGSDAGQPQTTIFQQPGPQAPAQQPFGLPFMPPYGYNSVAPAPPQQIIHQREFVHDPRNGNENVHRLKTQLAILQTQMSARESHYNQMMTSMQIQQATRSRSRGSTHRNERSNSSSAELGEYRAKVSSLQETLSTRDVNIIKLTNEVKSQEEDLSQMERSLKQTKASLEEEQRTRENLSHQLNVKSAELEELKSDSFKQQKKNYELTANNEVTVTSLSQRLKESERQINNLTNDLTQRQKESQEREKKMAALEGELNRRSAEIKTRVDDVRALKSSLKTAQSDTNDMQYLRRENDSLKRDIISKQTEIKRTKEKLEEAVEQLNGAPSSDNVDKLTADNDRLHNELEAFRTRIKDLEKRLKNEAASKETPDPEVERMKSENKRLKREIQGLLRAKASKLEAKVTDRDKTWTKFVEVSKDVQQKRLDHPKLYKTVTKVKATGESLQS